jgi:hypothetical protein
MFIYKSEKQSAFITEFVADPSGGFLWCERYLFQDNSSSIKTVKSLVSYQEGDIRSIAKISRERHNSNYVYETAEFKINLDGDLFYDCIDNKRRRIAKVDITKDRSSGIIYNYSFPEVTPELDDDGFEIQATIPFQESWGEFNILLPKSAYFYINSYKSAFVKSVINPDAKIENFFFSEMTKHFPADSHAIRQMIKNALKEKESNAFVFDWNGSLKSYALPEVPDSCCVGNYGTTAAFLKRNTIFFIDLE